MFTHNKLGLRIYKYIYTRNPKDPSFGWKNKPQFYGSKLWKQWSFGFQVYIYIHVINHWMVIVAWFAHFSCTLVHTALVSFIVTLAVGWQIWRRVHNLPLSYLSYPESRLPNPTTAFLSEQEHDPGRPRCGCNSRQCNESRSNQVVRNPPRDESLPESSKWDLESFEQTGAFTNPFWDLVGGFNPSKIWKSVAMTIPKIWKYTKCSKPPTSWDKHGRTCAEHFYEKELGQCHQHELVSIGPIEWPPSNQIGTNNCPTMIKLASSTH
jgi:hypothetical protein